MPNSPTKTTAAEWLLARLTTPTRAAAILGDLTELSATRGRLWFWTAYTRTLIALGWRTPIAFLCAIVISRWTAEALFTTVRHLVPKLYGNNHHAAPHPIWQTPLWDSLIALLFILPFVIIRFGLRDRLTRLALAIFLLTTPFYSLNSVGIAFAGIATAIMIVTALCLRTWRRPMIVLAATVAPAAVAQFFSGVALVFFWGYFGFRGPGWERAMTLYRWLEICIAALVCSFVYLRLLPDEPADLSTLPKQRCCTYPLKENGSI
jgi:hypothetical protein